MPRSSSPRVTGGSCSACWSPWRGESSAGWQLMQRGLVSTAATRSNNARECAARSGACCGGDAEHAASNASTRFTARSLLDHDVVDREHGFAGRISVTDPAGAGVLATPAPDPHAELIRRVHRVHAVVAAALDAVPVVDELLERDLVFAGRADRLPV